MATSLCFADPTTLLSGPEPLMLVGTKARLLSDQLTNLLPETLRPLWPSMLEAVSPGDSGKTASTWLPGAPPRRVVAGVLPDTASRHNSSARPHAVCSLVRDQLPDGARVNVVLAVERADDSFSVGCAVARALPQFTRKTAADAKQDRTITVGVLSPEGPVTDTRRIAEAAASIHLATRLTDTPTCDMNTDTMVQEAQQVAQQLGCEISVIRGDELAKGGFGGLWSVGRAAVHPPALVVLRHEPATAKRGFAWVGKGIVYDTGGLSLKDKEHMPGMKGDMGGAAAVLGAFRAAVKLGFPQRLYAVLCLAENAIGPNATRPDDIITLYSGKTVEVNNTDAEGRLVVSDGVAYSASKLKPDVIVDVATLTGAQLVATGKRHAAIVTSSEALESAAVRAGRASGDLVHPLLYCPEFFRAEFKSKVADFKNSVKDRMNTPTSCAAQFIAESLGDYKGGWLHVDIAGPSDEDERSTGFGIGLLLELFAHERLDSLPTSANS